MIWFVSLLAVAAFAAPFVIEYLRPDMDADRREGAPGQFEVLSSGITHFQWHGPADGPVLICIHGLTTPSYVWAQLLPGLTEAGFRYGRRRVEGPVRVAVHVDGDDDLYKTRDESDPTQRG